MELIIGLVNKQDRDPIKKGKVKKGKRTRIEKKN